MTKVDFYLAKDDGPRAGPVLACRLAEKAWKLGNKVYLHTAGPTEAQHLDELLWTFRDVAFVPHAQVGTEDDSLAVLVGHGEPPEGYDALLVNLAATVPPFFSKFERVAEIVGGEEAEKASARSRFKFYRDRGYELETHEV